MGLFSTPVIETDFSNYLLANREKLFASNLPRFSSIFLTYIDVLRSNETLNKQNQKRIIHLLICVNAYIRYATENILFIEAFEPQEDLKQFILDIRHGLISYEEQMSKLQPMLDQLEQVKDFYNKEPDLETFYEIKKEMMTLLDLEVRPQVGERMHPADLKPQIRKRGLNL